jgi:hypothetical protein
MFKNSNPAKTSHRGFIFIGVRFNPKLKQMKPEAKRPDLMPYDFDFTVTQLGHDA